MIKRDKYLKQLINSKENGFPKVITGIRRCGKSYLLNVIYKNYLVNNGVNENRIIEIDLTKISNAYYRDPIYLFEHIKKLIKDDNVYYIFIDEIQEVFPIVNLSLTNGMHIKAKPSDKEVIGFIDVVLDLSSIKNVDLYITGSNSKMLSNDIITQFRDRATNINLQPLSFEEFYKYKGEDSYKALHDFLIYGGMPLAVLKDGSKKEDYLKSLFETTYYKDILERNKIKKIEALDEICTLLATCIGDLINSEKIATEYKIKTKNKIDSDTVNSYINAFLDSFIIKQAFRYDLKGKKIISSTKKYYYVDNGLRNARLNFIYSDSGKMLENIVYNELIYNDYKVNVGTFDTFENDLLGKTTRKSLEIDFLAIKGNRSYYIQICDDYNESTKVREIKPYILLNDQITKVIVINKPIGEFKDEHGFTVIGICDFLLKFIK